MRIKITSIGARWLHHEKEGFKLVVAVFGTEEELQKLLKKIEDACAHE